MDSYVSQVCVPVKLAKAETMSFNIRPIRSISLTNPVAMNVAQTLMAADASSGDESAPKAGVRAEPIWA